MDGVFLARLCSSNIRSASLAPLGCLISVDWKVLINAGDLDGLIIATPPETHAQIALAAINEGLPVMVEKPMTASLMEATELCAIAAKTGVPVLVDHTQLFHPAYRRLKKLADSLGPVRRIYSAGGQWRGSHHKISPMWDYGAHDVAMTLDFMGQSPESVHLLARSYQPVEDTTGEMVEFRLGFTEGVYSSIAVGNAMAQKQRIFAVSFQDGSLVFDDCADNKLMSYPQDIFCNSMPKAPLDESGEPVELTGQLPLTQAIEEFASGIRHPKQLPESFGVDLAWEVIKVLDTLDGQHATAITESGGE